MVMATQTSKHASEDVHPSSDKAWYCLRAQSKREDVAAELLRQQDGLEVVMPRISYRKLTRRGVVKWVEPMFPCYLFAKLNLASDLPKVRSASGVSSVLHFNGAFAVVPPEVIDALKAQAGKDQLLELDNSPESTQPGDQVTLVQGAMAHTTAVVQEVLPAQQRVEVLIDFLGQPQVVQLDWKQVLVDKDPTTTPATVVA